MMARDQWLKYAVYYPFPGDKDYDPVKHAGKFLKIKCLREDAPKWAKRDYEAWKKEQEEGYK